MLVVIPEVASEVSIMTFSFVFNFLAPLNIIRMYTQLSYCIQMHIKHPSAHNLPSPMNWSDCRIGRVHFS